MTRATADLTAVMLEDSARLQENDCLYLNRKEKRRGIGCLQPFYDTRDARAIRRRFISERYGDTIKLAPRVTATRGATRLLWSPSPCSASSVTPPPRAGSHPTG